MRRRLMLVVVLFGLLMSLKSVNVLASGFNLKSIGSVDTSGRQISHWWYSGSVPVFSGEAPSGSTVTVSIDGNEGSVTAGGSNDWSYSPGSLSDGDHSVVITNNGSTINFTLTMGVDNVNWDAVNSDVNTSTLPTVGIIFPTALLSSVGLGLVVLAKAVAKKN
ncbi:MAG: Ig-like domain-containing protein [Candidatus Shapirobacteria bacterium]|nr:Ig-like domain-containing protein [Candidatus Shapirobacteria bacterium]